MKLQTGLNAYGLTYHLGLRGMGTPRANPNGSGLGGFLALGRELGAKTLKIWEGWLKNMGDAELAALRAHFDENGLACVVGSGLQNGDMPTLVRAAITLDAKYIRFALTPVLCGHRAACDWPAMVASVREKLGRYAPIAATVGCIILLENHQDFTAKNSSPFVMSSDLSCASSMIRRMLFLCQNRQSISPPTLPHTFDMCT